MTKRVYLYAFNNVLEIVDAKFLEDDAIFCAEHTKAGKLDEGYLSRTRSDLRRR